MLWIGVKFQVYASHTASVYQNCSCSTIYVLLHDQYYALCLYGQCVVFIVRSKYLPVSESLLYSHYILFVFFWLYILRMDYGAASFAWLHFIYANIGIAIAVQPINYRMKTQSKKQQGQIKKKKIFKMKRTCSSVFHS